MAFQKASRKKAFLKLALSGPSGSGKTMSALRLARGLTKGPIAFIDTENRSASLYANIDMTDARTNEAYKVEFDVQDLFAPYAAEHFINAIKDAKRGGYEVLVIDSFSHAWEAVLSYKEMLDRSGGNSYTNWNQAGKLFVNVIDLVRSIDMHVIVCMRSKMEYVLETNDKGKQAPRKIGLAPVVREGTEYEFSTMFEIGMDNLARDSKGRLRHITGGDAILLDEKVGAALRDWVSEGEEVPPPDVWTDEKKALANSLVEKLNDPATVARIKASGKTPTGMIEELTAAVKAKENQ